MSSHASQTDRQSNDPFFLRVLKRNVPIVVFLIVAMAGMLAIYFYFNPDSANVEAVSIADFTGNAGQIDPNAQLAPIVKPVKPLPVAQRMQQSPPPRRIGLIAGHRGNDSGTECMDGLTEVQITSSVVERVAKLLREQDIIVDSLDEFDTRLDQYWGTALVSVHVDSCDYVNELATGFKISGSPYTDSSKLTICLQQAYGEATQLPYHPDSITPHMSNYHAFSEINPITPALIIEIGFLNLDREILTNGSDQVVEGLTNGILCFLNQTS